MLGSGINPESFKLDYSGMANAAATQAKGVANLGASIGGAISEVGDYFKKQAEEEKKVQKSLSVAKAIGDLIPGLKPTIKNSLNILNDKEIPLSQRTAEADAIADILNLGINEVRNRQDVGFKERALNIQEAEALARNAPSQPTVNRKRVEKTGIFDGKTLKYDIYVDPNNPSDALYEDGTPVYGEGLQTSAAIDTGLNLSFPQFESVPDGEVLPPKTDPSPDFIPPPDGVPVVTDTPAPANAPTTTQTTVVDDIPTGQAGGRRIPPGATLVQEKPEVAETFRAATPEEAAEYGAVAGQINEQTKRFYPISLPTGMTVESDGQGGIKVVQGSGVGAKTEKAERAAKFQETRQTNFIIDKANEAEEIMDNSISTYGGGTLIDMAKSAIPGTQEYKLKNQILPALKDSIALDSMKQLKAASPTGSTGLGSLTEKEGKRLENMYGVLDVGGDKVTLKNDIKRLKQTAFDYIHGSKDERKKALAEGKITKDQNDQVEQMYREQILRVPGAKTPASSSPFTLSPEAEDVSRRHPTGK